MRARPYLEVRTKKQEGENRLIKVYMVEGVKKLRIEMSKFQHLIYAKDDEMSASPECKVCRDVSVLIAI